MTKEQAQILINEFGVDELLLNDEDSNSLQDANPELLEACRALNEFAFNLEQESSELADAKRLDFLQNQLGSYTGKVICRDSVNGRGWRLHETEQAGAVDDVRKAIDNYILEKVNI